MSKSGSLASFQSISAYEAKPSLSQMSSHRSGVTASPNHMWASSWDRKSSMSATSMPNVDRVWVSSARPVPSGTTIAPYSSNGYGPNSSSKASIMSPASEQAPVR